MAGRWPLACRRVLTRLPTLTHPPTHSLACSPSCCACCSAMEFALAHMDRMAKRVELSDPEQVKPLIRSSIGTKFSSRYGDLVADLALEAVRRVTLADDTGRLDIDTKRYARVEKLPGGELDECRVLDGIMIEKDVTHPVRQQSAIRQIRLHCCACDSTAFVQPAAYPSPLTLTIPPLFICPAACASCVRVPAS